jgi:hypothetical protein
MRKDALVLRLAPVIAVCWLAFGPPKSGAGS